MIMKANSTFQFSKSYFIKRNSKFLSRIPIRYIETLVEVCRSRGEL